MPKKHPPKRVNGTVPPARAKNVDVRPREYLTPEEVDRLIKIARGRGRHAIRDAAMILVCYTHALRVSELVALRWSQINFKEGTLQVRRLKNSTGGTHPLRGQEIRLLREWQKIAPDSPYIFTNERSANPVSSAGFRKTLARIGEAAKFPWRIHPHMLRHARGYNLVNRNKDIRIIQAYMGHKDINHTSRYTTLSPTKFEELDYD